MPDNQASESSTLSNHIGILSASDATEPETAPRSDPSKPEAPLSQTGAGILKAVKPLSIKSFPNRPRSEKSPLPTTIANLHFILESYGVLVRYNVIKKKIEVLIPGHKGAPDNIDNVVLSYIFSLALLNGMQIGPIPGYIEVVGDNNLYNPVANWIESKPWDGTNRLAAIYATLTVHPEFPVEFKERLIYRWLLSCVAAALTPSGFTCRGVLTIQGSQGLGKTRWIAALVSDPLLRDQVLRLGHHLDARNKDDVISAVSHWIVEIGELDSSFKKDVAALKGFLTNDSDKIRRPYGKADSEYPRKTVFAATVNDHNFLVDTTGNTRFWVLPVVAINHQHGIDMQQLFAQLRIDFERGEQWWLSDSEQAMLESLNSQHRSVSAIRESIEAALEFDPDLKPKIAALTATELLKCLGYKNPSNGQCKEANTALRELLGEPIRIKGYNYWIVPLKAAHEFVCVP